MSSCNSCYTAIQMPFAGDVLTWLSESLTDPEECLNDLPSVNSTNDLVRELGSTGTTTYSCNVVTEKSSKSEIICDNNSSASTTSTSTTNSGCSNALRLPVMQPVTCSTSNGTSSVCTGGHQHAHAVFMYSTAADGNVTLQLRDACSGGDDCSDIVRGERLCNGIGGCVDENSDLVTNGAGVTTLSISYQDIATDLLGDANSIDVLLGTAAPNGVSSTVCTATLHAASGVNDECGSTTQVLDLFDSSSRGQEQQLPLSPQSFTPSTTEAFISDNSDSLGVPPDTDTGSTEEDTKKAATNNNVTTTTTTISNEITKLAVKRARPKAASPNRQGPQQCQVCSKIFGNASALAKHKLTHSDERKYVCMMCGKAFKRQDHLNGHMLTHRNKKPYECKAEGCGKSYCDARSLRRHTENHHSSSLPTLSTSRSSTPSRPATLISGNASVSTSTLSPAQGAASGDAASPHGAASSTCIQYAPPPTGSTNSIAEKNETTKKSSNHGTVGGNGSTSSNLKQGKSQLQQLLASEPSNKSGSNQPNNDGLTKQQLDLIHQIMEQTQRQSQQVTSAGSSTVTTSTKNPIRNTSHPKPKLARTWSAPVQSTTKVSASTNTSPTGSSQNLTTTGLAPGTQTPVSNPPIPKPVECNLCHRKFKNVPALNGHMRLHGGYFKKDAENKKSEKKELVGPPLQTASVSVRALIEEKIINKRSTSQNMVTQTTSSSIASSTPTTVRSTLTSNAPPLYPLTNHNNDVKVTSFVIPASPTGGIDKSKRDSFSVPRTPSSPQVDAEVIADLILKRAKVVKRAASDPGYGVQKTPPPTPMEVTVPSPQRRLQLQLEQAGEAFALANITFQNDDDSEIFTQSLQDEVFNQVQQTMLLQGIDASSLENIQSTEEHLQDIAELEEYATVTAELQTSHHQDHNYQNDVNEELQAVLDSPLPESLAEFSTYHSDINSPKDSTFTQNLPQRQYQSSPHPIITTPLQSPLIRHDSPGFAYPTPPGSHEEQSPGLSNSHLLPLLSPQNDNPDLEPPPQASSPLSAAFYIGKMSSAEAVEEALEEVLPGETINPEESYTNLTPFPQPEPPPPQPPPEIPPKPPTPTQMIQSQMMPNSEDPLLSSNPKDFHQQRPNKRFEFGSFQSFKIVSTVGNNGLVDLTNPALTGILVDTNGELRFIQTTNPFSTKNIVVTSTGNLNAVTSQAQGPTTVQIIQQPIQTTTPPTQLITIPKNTIGNTILGTFQPMQHSILHNKLTKTQYTIPTKVTPPPPPKLQITVDETNDVFLSPTSLASPIRTSRKRPRSEPPCTVPITHQSHLRASRTRPTGLIPFTPPPILNPNRTGPGLYAHAKWKAVLPSNRNGITKSEGGGIPECDSVPHINIGPQFQCTVPPLMSVGKDNREPLYEHLLWDPGINSICTEAEVSMYLELACCAAVPGGGRNKEYALHLLHLCGGNIQDALVRLLHPSPMLPKDHTLLSYTYAGGDCWSQSETDAFHRALLKYNKDFHLVAQEVSTKTTSQCVQFYYVWKKVCADEYKRIKSIANGHRHRDTPPDYIRKGYDNIEIQNDMMHISSTQPDTHRTFSCEYTDCSASFNSRAALNGHIRIHGGTVRRSPTPQSAVTISQPQLTFTHNSTLVDTTRRLNTLTTTNNMLSDVFTSRSSGPSIQKIITTNRTLPSLITSTHNHHHHHDHLHPSSTATTVDEYPCKVCGKVFTKIKSRSAHMKSHRPPDAESRRPNKYNQIIITNNNNNLEMMSSSSSQSSSTSLSSSPASFINETTTQPPPVINLINSPLVTSSQ